jgi:predicted flap endonuclease-1-like 5' DNA nuclease
MTYLLAKYTLLFLMASALGFVLGYWWLRRSFVDVSESYEDLRKATEQTDAANWDRLWNRLDALTVRTETDLSSVFERLDTVRGAVAGIPKPNNVDLVPVESQLKSLSGQIANIPVPIAPSQPDFSPLTDRIEKLEMEIHAIPAPADIGSLGKRLQDVETAVRGIPEPAPQKVVDLQPVQNALASIRDQIKGLPKVETHEPVDLAPVTRQIGAIEKRVSTISQPEKVDLTPIDGRLRSIETEIGRLGKRLTRPAKSTKTKPVEPELSRQRSKQPKILSAALYGKQDDLKQILGVGPKLERLLNKNGVFYFWQVASWSHGDIEVIDQRLDTFKGRISRDNWVSQAKQLTRSPGAASIPAE